MGKLQHDQTLLGNILIELGHTNRQTIGRALISKDQLGQTLLRWREITPEQLQEALIYQKVYKGELSPTEASRLHKQKRRALMSDVLKQLRTMAQLTGYLHRKLE